VHFNQFSENKGRFGAGYLWRHVIPLARALSFNEDMPSPRGDHGGRHVAPLFAGGTVFAWSEILETADVPGRSEVGALRVLTRATRDLPCTDHPVADGSPDTPGVILELDYWALMPR
jgi:2-methylfumaryl-CoA hydratase